MIRLNKNKQQKIHNRKIETTIYDGEADTIIVEGALTDERFCDSHLFTGEIRPPFTVHHLIVRMELQLPGLTIVDIEVDMPAVPHAYCRDILDCLQPLVGTRIAFGFTSRVRKLVDRKKACTHLLTLVTAMAPAAFQGAWSARIREPVDPEIYAEMMSKLKNTCWAWREDGPLVEKIKAGR